MHGDRRVIRSGADEPARFGTLLRRFRTAANLSQEQLAERARVSVEGVGALERGTRRAPQRQTLALLIEALDLTPHERELLTLAAVRPSSPRARAAAGTQPLPSWSSAPSLLTPFLGRDADVAAVLSLCRANRLTSVVGPGGVGKTRLAMEVARAAHGVFPDGVTVAALAPAAVQAPLLPVIAAALSVRDEGAGALADRIVAAIGERTMMCIVDNCEHVLDELAAVLGDLLARCGNLHVLATSRQRLRIDGERTYRLRPLSIGHAVDVFVDRAAANAFDATIDEHSLSLIAEICDRLDRVPLAIELAASCSNVLAFEAILERLRERFPLPTTPARSALPQHRSMQALVEWSHDRLDAAEATVFRRLAPFAGGARLDDAQAVIAGDPLTNDDVLYALFRLHEQSLLEADRASMPRFHMLQTIRDYADDRLRGDERPEVLRGFAGHYLTLVAATDADLRSARQGAAIERISAESPNVRAALFEFQTTPELATVGLAALGALSHYWLRSGNLTEGAGVYAAIDFSRFAPSRELASALIGAAFVELNRRFTSRAHDYAIAGARIAHAAGDPWLEIYAAIADQTIATLSGEFAAGSAFEPFYQRARELGDPWLMGSAAYRMAALAAPLDPAASDAYLESALTHAESSGDPFAIQSIQLALARSRTNADPRRALALTAAVWEQLSAAHLLRKSHCVHCLAGIALVLRRPDDAAYLTGVADALSRRSGAPDADRGRLRELVRHLEAAEAALTAGMTAPEGEAAAHVTDFIRSAGDGSSQR